MRIERNTIIGATDLKKTKDERQMTATIFYKSERFARKEKKEMSIQN